MVTGQFMSEHGPMSSTKHQQVREFQRPPKSPWHCGLVVLNFLITQNMQPGSNIALGYENLAPFPCVV